jgi:hypothetical protein
MDDLNVSENVPLLENEEEAVQVRVVKLADAQILTTTSI